MERFLLHTSGKYEVACLRGMAGGFLERGGDCATGQTRANASLNKSLSLQRENKFEM